MVERIAYYPFHEVLGIEEVLKYTITGIKGLGGYETKGKCRRGGPAAPQVLREQTKITLKETDENNQEILGKLETSETTEASEILETLAMLDQQRMNIKTQEEPQKIYIWTL